MSEWVLALCIRSTFKPAWTKSGALLGRKSMPRILFKATCRSFNLAGPLGVGADDDPPDPPVVVDAVRAVREPRACFLCMGNSNTFQHVYICMPEQSGRPACCCVALCMRSFRTRAGWARHRASAQSLTDKPAIQQNPTRIWMSKLLMKALFSLFEAPGVVRMRCSLHACCTCCGCRLLLEGSMPAAASAKGLSFPPFVYESNTSYPRLGEGSFHSCLSIFHLLRTTA